MSDDLYTADILRWSGQQADLLRRLAQGERVNDAIDWENVIEEIDSVGRSELTAVKSLLRRAMEHLLKLHAWPERSAPDGGPQEHWRAETMTFLADAQDRWAPSMRQNIDLAPLFARARLAVSRLTVNGKHPPELPRDCPFTIDELIPSPLLPDMADVDHLLARLATAAAG